VILGLVQEAQEAGARLSRAADVVGIDPRTLQRWKGQGVGDDGRAGPRTEPGNKLTRDERRKVLAAASRPDLCDASPKQIVPRLADAGVYLASESSFYRILREEQQIKHRESSRPPAARSKPDELVATGPNQVWSWDITYLRSPIKGVYFYLYLVLDIWSRKVVGWEVHDRECGELASEVVAGACAEEEVQRDQLTVHSDNGSPMKAATLLATLEALGIARSFSRPHVSNDNPFSESIFRTLKYRPEFPSLPFASLEAARQWVASFVEWYNTQHLHSAIRFVTPDDRHAGREADVLAARARLYEQARAQRPDRWTGATRNWTPVAVVKLNPEQAATSAEAA